MTLALSFEPAISDPFQPARGAVMPRSLDVAAGREIVAEASSIHVGAAPSLIPTLRRRRAVPQIQVEPARRRSPPRKTIAAVCALTLACLALAGRERIVARIPATDRAFAAIGLPVNLAGVEFRNVASKVTEIDGQKVLAVTGEVVNLRAAQSSAVPGLTLTARGADGRALYVWTTAAATSKLGPGETTTFRSRLAAPPDEARDVMVALAEPARHVAQADAVKLKDPKGKSPSK